jgi:retron-type reverse transcriptase
MTSLLVKHVRTMATLGSAWAVIQRNGRSSRSVQTRREIEKFAPSAIVTLTKIQRQLDRRAFRFMPATGVAAAKKGNCGIRPLVIAPIESRIVQRAIHDVLLGVPAIVASAENPYSFGGVRKRRGEEFAAVPAAIKAVLEAIGAEATYVIRSDISSFFTRISKQDVTAIVARATGDSEFVELFSQAITVELGNLASLREHIPKFPIAEMGVAQGCSLSPLLGNLILSNFDSEMNSGDCRCIRYIDDFIILAPDKAAGEACFLNARRHLERLGMYTSRDKTHKGAIDDGFEFLGIELAHRAIRPTKESRDHLLASVREVFAESASAFRSSRKSGELPRSLSLIRALYEASAIIYGWGRHYKFCNEINVFRQIDAELDNLLREYLGAYNAERSSADQRRRRNILGVPLLGDLVSSPFDWPAKVARTYAAAV